MMSFSASPGIASRSASTSERSRRYSVSGRVAPVGTIETIETT